MSLRSIISSVLVTCLLSAPATGQAISLAPGQWETSSIIEVSIEENGETVETFPVRQSRSDICIDAGEAQLRAELLAGDDCTSLAERREGLSLIMDLSCQHDNRTYSGTMIARGAENGQGALAEMELATTPDAGRSIHVSATLTGRHTGPCL